jgi:hypothetical protein
LVEAPELGEKCRFYDDCSEARGDRLLCISGAFSELCEEYQRLERKKRNTVF